MELWHLTPDAPRIPNRPCPTHPVELWIGTWPIEPDQSVWIEYETTNYNGARASNRAEAIWHHNSGPNSHWRASLGPFSDGDTVSYTVCCRDPKGATKSLKAAFAVGPNIHLAILWHQHQPLYLEKNGKKERYRFPWVRLHAIRDYYSMAALVAKYPQVHLTINLVPSLLWQIEGYLKRNATDRGLELTRKPAARLTDAEREDLLSSFFDADWHNQIYIYPRYKELFEQRIAGKTFTTQDLTDLQMWFNLAWFAPEFLTGKQKLHDGTMVNLEFLVRKGRDFTSSDIRTMLDAQYSIMGNIVPLHRTLQESGQIEVSTTPFYHPILPLIHDTNVATIDRPGTTLPERFQAPEDAQTQVSRAIEFYEKRFGVRPQGMWPAEGAVGQSIVNYFTRNRIRWIASDKGVLERSGRWGYRVDDPNVLCQPYHAEDTTGSVSIFFRDQTLSDAIGFKYQAFPNQKQAAESFLWEIKHRLADRVSYPENRVVSVILDGENAWGSYPQAARPFFHALYEALSHDPEIKTVTFREYLDGNPARALPPHPLESQPKVYDLFHGSWIDECGSAPGVDLGTWIGEEEENRAWELLKETRETLIASGASPETHPEAFESLYAAEGSDWFWWFGDDQESGYDDVFDDLFRMHLRSVYRGIKRKPPKSLDMDIVPHTVVWTFARPIPSVQFNRRLTIRTNCNGTIRWSCNGWQTEQEIPMIKAGGVMAGVHSFSLTLGPFPGNAKAMEFVFRCGECDCKGMGTCCGSQVNKVIIKSGNKKGEK